MFGGHGAAVNHRMTSLASRVCSDEHRMFRVDAHHHLWDLAVRDQPWIGGSRARAAAPLVRGRGARRAGGARHRRHRASCRPSRARGDAGAARAGRRARADRRRRRLGRPDRARRRRRAGRAGARVARRHPSPGPGRARPALAVPRRTCARGLRAVADAGLVYDLLTLPAQLPAAIDTVRALDDLVFVVDHLSKPPIASGELEPWATHDARAGRARERRLQALGHGHRGRLGGAGASPICARTRRRCSRPSGRTGVMFGSDWPVCTLAASYGQVVAAAEELTAGLSGAERDADLRRHRSSDVYAGTEQRSEP